MAAMGGAMGTPQSCRLGPTWCLLELGSRSASPPSPPSPASSRPQQAVRGANRRENAIELKPTGIAAQPSAVRGTHLVVPKCQGIPRAVERSRRDVEVNGKAPSVVLFHACCLASEASGPFHAYSSFTASTEEEQMNLQKTYTALLTADLVAAESWYTKLLGRAPDYRPMDTLVQWELFDDGGVMLSTSDEIAGRGVMFLIVDDIAAERRRLQGLGIVLGDDIQGDYSTLAQVRDPDGNLLTLATPPSRPYPAA